MRRFVLPLLAWAAPLYACPTLAGRYVCTYQASQEVLVVTEQRAADGVVTYDYNGSPLISDGRSISLPDDLHMREQTLRAWCDDAGVLRGELRARYYDSSNYAGELALRFTYLRVGPHVRQITEGRLISPTGTLPLNSDVTCFSQI